MDVTILQAIQISVWCLFTLRETEIISKTTHIKEKGATASGFTPLASKWKLIFFLFLCFMLYSIPVLGGLYGVLPPGSLSFRTLKLAVALIPPANSAVRV